MENKNYKYYDDYHLNVTIGIVSCNIAYKEYINK